MKDSLNNLLDWRLVDWAHDRIRFTTVSKPIDDVWLNTLSEQARMVRDSIDDLQD